MNFYTDHDYWVDDEVEELKSEARAQRAFSRRLAAHPDFRDPDYPECEPEEDENTDE